MVDLGQQCCMSARHGFSRKNEMPVLRKTDKTMLRAIFCVKISEKRSSQELTD